jgi:biopolymer transport protein ExbB/TolQ
MGHRLILGLWYIAYVHGKQRDWRRTRRIRALVLGRALIPVLPLSGIGGTVWGLIKTLAFMGGQPDGKIDMPGVVARFSVALNTTFWGVVFAVLALVLYQTALSQLEGAEGDG